MRILVIPAPFKECAGARTMARLISSAVLRTLPDAHITTLIVSDGGTGFAQWLIDLTMGLSGTYMLRGSMETRYRLDLV